MTSAASRAAHLLLGGLVRVLLPPLCPLCRRALASSSLLLCQACSSTLRELEEPLCTCCGLPFSGAGPSHPCPRCLRQKTTFESLRAWGLYSGALLEAIHAFKYRGDRGVRHLLQSLFLEGFERYWPTETFSSVVPVPAHRETLRRRGFDLPALLARCLARERGIAWRPRALLKAKATPDLVRLKHKEREAAVREVFFPRQALEGQVLLVDDVATSTSTARACARACLDAGASRVQVLVLARTPLAGG